MFENFFEFFIIQKPLPVSVLVIDKAAVPVGRLVVEDSESTGEFPGSLPIGKDAVGDVLQHGFHIHVRAQVSRICQSRIVYHRTRDTHFGIFMCLRQKIPRERDNFFRPFPTENKIIFGNARSNRFVGSGPRPIDIVRGVVIDTGVLNIVENTFDIFVFKIPGNLCGVQVIGDFKKNFCI